MRMTIISYVIRIINTTIEIVSINHSISICLFFEGFFIHTKQNSVIKFFLLLTELRIALCYQVISKCIYFSTGRYYFPRGIRDINIKDGKFYDFIIEIKKTLEINSSVSIWFF